VHVVSQRARVLRLRRTEQITREIHVLAVLPSFTKNGVGILLQTGFSKLNSRPTDTSVYASSATSRRRLRDSRPEWIRCSPFLFIPALSELPVIRSDTWARPDAATRSPHGENLEKHRHCTSCCGSHTHCAVG
jgi:hypothetical protein